MGSLDWIQLRKESLNLRIRTFKTEKQRGKKKKDWEVVETGQNI
jgi:hypothetical protein